MTDIETRTRYVHYTPSIAGGVFLGIKPGPAVCEKTISKELPPEVRLPSGDWVQVMSADELWEEHGIQVVGDQWGADDFCWQLKQWYEVREFWEYVEVEYDDPKYTSDLQARAAATFFIHQQKASVSDE